MISYTHIFQMVAMILGGVSMFMVFYMTMMQFMMEEDG